MMHLKDYCNAIPDFALYLRFAKQERFIYQLIDKQNRDDLYQVIALSVLSGNDKRSRNNLLKKEMRYFATRILNYRMPSNTEKQKPNATYYYKAKEEHTCDLCGKTSNHYVYKKFIPDKIVCRLCYNKLRRQDIKRNKLN